MVILNKSLLIFSLYFFVNIILFLNIIGKFNLHHISQAMQVNSITTCSFVLIMKQTITDISTYFYILFRLKLNTFFAVSSSSPVNWNGTKPEISTSVQISCLCLALRAKYFSRGTQQQQRQVILISKQKVLRG